MSGKTTKKTLWEATVAEWDTKPVFGYLNITDESAQENPGQTVTFTRVVEGKPTSQTMQTIPLMLTKTIASIRILE